MPKQNDIEEQTEECFKSTAGVDRTLKNASKIAIFSMLLKLCKNYYQKFKMAISSVRLGVSLFGFPLKYCAIPFSALWVKWLLTAKVLVYQRIMPAD